MKNLLLIIIAAALSEMPIQAQQVLDTIYANETKNVALFFTSPVRQAVTGAEHFVFTYNREREQYFGLLQAQQGVESNLLVITKDGCVYSYLLKYAKEVLRLNYFISHGESIGRERPLEESESVQFGKGPRPRKGNDYYRRAAEYLLDLPEASIAAKRKNGIKLEMERMVHNNSEVFIVLEAANHSDIPFELDFLNIAVINGDRGKRAAHQRLIIPIIYAHKRPKLLLTGHSYRFVILLPKFVPGDGERVEIEMKEANGNRNLRLVARP